MRNTDKNSEREIEKKWKNKTKGEGGVCEMERELKGEKNVMKWQKSEINAK